MLAGHAAATPAASPADSPEAGDTAHWEAVIDAAVDSTNSSAAGTVLPNVGATLAALREGIVSVDAELQKQVRASRGDARGCQWAAFAGRGTVR